MSKVTTESFIEKAIKIHGDKYDYSKVDYKKSSEKIIIKCKEHGDFLQTPNNHIEGKECKNCGIKKRSKSQASDTIEFIEKANKVYEDKYDYSKVKYLNSITKVTIICKVHNFEFLQIPAGHLASKNGCPKCSGNFKSNTIEFIEKANKVHGNKYDYSKVNYKNCDTKIIIICNRHGDFLQTPYRHLQNRGCQKCAGTLKLNTQEFIEKAIKLHGDKYDYSKVEYKKANGKVIIICKIHGNFKQQSNLHLYGSGCSKCSGKYRYDTNEFIERANLIYKDKYDYSKVNYVNCNKTVIIICNLHNFKFKQVPYSHIKGFEGCLKCLNIGYSKSQIIWLDLLSKLNNIYIQHAMNDGEFKIPTTNFKADGYCKDTNTIFEFHGDYWHGNPKIFDPNLMNKTCDKTHGELYRNTLKKEQIIKDLGYNLVTIWESDWNKFNKNIKKIQKKFRN